MNHWEDVGIDYDYAFYTTTFFIGDKMRKIALILASFSAFSTVKSDSDSEPRYLDQFSVKFGDSESIKSERRSDQKLKRQTQDDLEVSAVLSDLLRTERQGQRRTFPSIPGADLVRKGAQNLNDDIHALFDDILNGNDEDFEDERENRIIIKQIQADEERILKALRDLEEETDDDNRPVRFNEQNRNPLFSDNFGNEGLRPGKVFDTTPNLSNRGRFNPDRPSDEEEDDPRDEQREPRQQTETVNEDGSIERCENTGFETRTRTECNEVTDTECETVDKVGYRSEIVPQCR